MFRRLLLVVAVALTALPSQALQPLADTSPFEANDAWREEGGRLLVIPAAISLPLRIGDVSFERQPQPTSLGRINSYRSPDGDLGLVVRVRYIGLAHPGLAASSSELGMRIRQPAFARSNPPWRADASNRTGTVVRSDFVNSATNRSLLLAFIGFDRWIMELRLTAPLGRQEEASTIMTALLAGLRFDAMQPRQAAPLEMVDCTAPMGSRANLLPDSPWELSADRTALTHDDPSRVPPRWCLSEQSRINDPLAQVTISILRAVEGSPIARPVRSHLFASIGDLALLEVVELVDRRRYVVLLHNHGTSDLLGAYDALPSNEQIIAILTGRDETGGRVRARVRPRPGAPPEFIE